MRTQTVTRYVIVFRGTRKNVITVYYDGDKEFFMINGLGTTPAKDYAELFTNKLEALKVISDLPKFYEGYHPPETEEVQVELTTKVL